MDAILASALELFAELGFGAVTMDAVAKRVPMSKETLYQLFPGKPALFRAVLENQIRKWAASERGEQPLPAAPTLRESLKRFIELMIRASASPEFNMMSRLVQEEAYRFPELAAVLHEQGTERAVAACADIIEHFARLDNVPCRRSGDVAALIISAVHAWMREAGMYPHKAAGPERTAWINRTLDIFMASRSVW